MNLDKSFAFKGFKEELAIRYGKEKADKMWQYANQECAKTSLLFLIQMIRIKLFVMSIWE